MSNKEILRILSPLLFFLAHVVYLIFWSQDPFLKKWIDGCFTFFLALVLCNIIRARVASSQDTGDKGLPASNDPGEPGGNCDP